MVPSGYVNWVIENNVNIEPERGYMASACAQTSIVAGLVTKLGWQEIRFMETWKYFFGMLCYVY